MHKLRTHACGGVIDRLNCILPLNCTMCAILVDELKIRLIQALGRARRREKKCIHTPTIDGMEGVIFTFLLSTLFPSLPFFFGAFGGRPGAPNDVFSRSIFSLSLIFPLRFFFLTVSVQLRYILKNIAGGKEQKNVRLLIRNSLYSIVSKRRARRMYSPATSLENHKLSSVYRGYRRRPV